MNAVGTLNLLEAARSFCAESPFVFLSTNKVYGDAPNELPLVELETRWDFEDPLLSEGIDESCRVDKTMHSLFGASKLAADVLVQEYGRYFGCPRSASAPAASRVRTMRARSCTGSSPTSPARSAEGVPYRVFGYKGKQVRDNLHSYDVCTAIAAFAEEPRSGAVYNLGGGRANSVSMLEAIDRFESLFGRKLAWEYVDEPRRGDHICYISDLRRFRADYPDWTVSRSLDVIFDDFAQHARATVA